MGAAAARFTRRWYFALALSAYVLSPELRRITDWLTSFHKLSVFSVLPIAVMMPAALLLYAQWPKLGRVYRTVALLWCGAFVVAAVIGFMASSPIAAGYDFLEFFTPPLFAVFLAAANEDPRDQYNRVAGTMLVLAVISSLYAIYQYISPPPWDVYWVENAGLVTLGVPEPFGLRIFGTMNAFATFALFVALAMFANLPRLSRRNWRSAVGFVPCSIALLITIDRTAWLAFALGLLVYFVLSPRRKAAAGAVATTLFCVACASALLLSLKGADSVASMVQDRFSTFGALGDDNSFHDRSFQTSQALHLGLDEPLGQGLGNVGTAAIAGSSSATNTLDNGYLARFVELGVFGCALYLAALAAALYLIWKSYKAELRDKDAFAASALAACVGLQLMMLGSDLSTDTHDSVLALFFWWSLYVASRFQSEREHALHKVTVTSGPIFSRKRLRAEA